MGQSYYKHRGLDTQDRITNRQTRLRRIQQAFGSVDPSQNDSGCDETVELRLEARPAVEQCQSGPTVPCSDLARLNGRLPLST
ncbi:hypothetical protein SKAU_G00100500 [Synaphobranchus kaupii]|uniref:Uncharacterized protein n=1 Tax=Synaphobranchus kaupii TaxID=118154 RepID=A0A9Q1J6B7_SYNKA|nr:hypothetical protein SKAU_G00100500 [Synaphobranchus kaupii]